MITRQKDYIKEGIIVVNSLEEAIEKALAIDPNPYVIGSGEIYAQALPLADVIEFTRVHHTFPEADVFFPKFNTEEWDFRFYYLYIESLRKSIVFVVVY